jgi:hypothetical protein
LHQTNAWGVPGGDGGGVYCLSATLTICRIIGNVAGNGGSNWCWAYNGGRGGNGGGISSNSAALINCFIAGNLAGDGGDGVFFGGGPGEGGKGGGIDDRQKNTVMNCTLAANAAGFEGAPPGGSKGPQQKGGGISTSIAVVTNCILWNNTPDQIEGASPEVTFCDLERGWPGVGNINADPLFVDPANDDYHLTWTSPCINMGTDIGAPTADIDGDLRPIMGTTDIGADEFTGVHPLAANKFGLPHSTKTEKVSFTLNAGAAHGGCMYVILCGLSGTAPGAPLPGGNEILPVNWDIVTTYVLNKIFLPNFGNFLGTLDPAGGASAVFDPDGILTGLAGLTMSFAYATNAPWFASNPINVEILY